MCYLCLRTNPFDVIDKLSNQFPKDQKNKAKAQILKTLIKRIEKNDKDRCDSGEDMFNKLKEEQYRLAKEL